MSEKRVIEDPGQWRVGDDVRIEWRGGAVLTAKATKRKCTPDDRGLLAGPYLLRVGEDLVPALMDDGNPTVTVTRTVEPIPEPTEWLSGVKFADGTEGGRFFAGESAWGESGTSSWVTFTWQEMLRQHGAPVAVSLPRWSDEVEPWRAAVRASLVVLSSRLSDAGAREVVENNLRALLAEGGEA